jgi:HAMP domain-containing protein
MLTIHGSLLKELQNIKILKKEIQKQDSIKHPPKTSSEVGLSS